jgi:hypothetical protein
VVLVYAGVGLDSAQETLMAVEDLEVRRIWG